MSRIKILLLIPHLGGGGAEQVTAMLARYLDSEIFDVHLGLITADHLGAKPIPESVTIHRINVKRVRNACPALIRIIWAQHPDVVLSSMAHLNFLTLILKWLFPRNSRIVVRQNTTASSSSNSRLTRLMYRALYPHAAQVICQSAAMADDLVFNFKLCPSKLVVLANPIDVQNIRAKQSKSISILKANSSDPFLHGVIPQLGPSGASHLHKIESPTLLAVGRLAVEKGFDLLLQALSIVRKSCPLVRLLIVGSGPTQFVLSQLCCELDLEDRVTFAGYHSDLSSFYAASSLYVLCSRYEGMPNALLEAAAAGLPLVVTPCCQGILDLLNASGPSPGSDVPTKDVNTSWNGVQIASSITAAALAEAILNALDLISISREARFTHNFLVPFELDTAIRAYQDLLWLVATAPGHLSPQPSLTRQG